MTVQPVRPLGWQMCWNRYWPNRTTRPNRPPEIFCRLIDQLMSPADRLNEGSDRPRALAQLNEGTWPRRFRGVL